MNISPAAVVFMIACTNDRLLAILSAVLKTSAGLSFSARSPASTTSQNPVSGFLRVWWPLPPRSSAAFCGSDWRSSQYSRGTERPVKVTGPLR